VFKLEVANTIRELIAPVFQDVGIELVDLQVKKPRQGWMVEVFADKEQGGISLDECAAINKRIVHILDEEGILGEDYELYVSSPGIDRPLKTEKDFKRVMGREVRFHLKEPVEAKLEYAGEIQAVEDQSVIVKTKGQRLKLNLDNIQKAVQII